MRAAERISHQRRSSSWVILHLTARQQGKVFEREKVGDFHDACEYRICFSLTEELSAEVEIHTTLRYLNHILSQRPVEDLKEVLMRIEVLHRRIVNQAPDDYFMSATHRIINGAQMRQTNLHAPLGTCHVVPPPGEASPLA